MNSFKSTHANHRESIRHSHNLLAVHGASIRDKNGNTPRGRRTYETSIHRAVIVTATASWQAVIESLLKATIETNNGRPINNAEKLDISRFSTPSSIKIRSLFFRLTRDSAGNWLDPAERWTWTTRNGRSGRSTMTSTEAATRLDAWVQIRHNIAHGNPDLFSGLNSIKTADSTQDPYLLNPTNNSIEQNSDHAISTGDVRHLVSSNFRNSGGSATLQATDARQYLTFLNRMVTSTAEICMIYCGINEREIRSYDWNVTSDRVF